MRLAAIVVAGALAASWQPGSVAAAAPASTLREIRTWSLGDSTRIAIEVDGALKFHYDKLTDPPRLFFDLDETSVGSLRGAASTITVGDPVVRQVRVGILRKGVARVVIDLFEVGEYTVSQLTNPSRLVVEVRRGPSLQPAPQPAPAPPAVVPMPPPVTVAAARPATRPGRRMITLPAKKTTALPKTAPLWTLARQPSYKASLAVSRIPQVPVLWELQIPDRPKAQLAKGSKAPVPGPPAQSTVSAPPTAPSPSPVAAKVASPAREPNEPTEPMLDARPAQKTRLGDRSLTRALGLKLRRVVIDAGHGGHDTGTISRTGLKEKDLVLDVGLRLGALIEERLGSEVVYTRSDDTFIPLEDRTAFANRQKADLFLSIHANSSPAKSAAGMETFYLNFTTSKDDLEVAARENASSEKSIHDLSDLVRRITLQDKVDESREFAARVQSAGYELTSKTHGRVRNRGVKKAPFVVLIGARMPSVLVEIGFLSNSKEETLLKKAEHRTKIAEALFKGVSRYADSLSHFRVAQTSGARSGAESR